MLSFFAREWAPAAEIASRAVDMARAELHNGSSAEHRAQAQAAAVQFSLVAGEALRRSGDLQGSLRLLDGAYRSRLEALGEADAGTVAARKCAPPLREPRGAERPHRAPPFSVCADT